ncbi:MAG: DUF3299 domain-containing protein [Pseudomonadota bacterium]
MRKGLALICALLTFVGGASAESLNIDWTDLVDESTQVYEDPYAELEFDVLTDVISFARLQQKLAGSELSGDDLTQARQQLDARRAEFAEQDIDVDWLLSQRWVVAERRRTAAETGNSEVDGARVTLAGFAIPAPSDPDGTPVVYLVPERGMCSHMPPPNPNQMLRVRLTTGWTPSMMHEPVQLTGQLDLDWSEQSIVVVDGFVTMRASYAMEASKVVTVRDMQPNTQIGNDWMQKLAAKLRPSVHESTAATE